MTAGLMEPEQPNSNYHLLHNWKKQETHPTKRDIQGSGLSNYVETFYTILGEQTSLDLLSLSAEIIVIGVLLYYGYYASNSLYSYPYNYHYYSGYNRRKYRPHHYKYRKPSSSTPHYESGSDYFFKGKNPVYSYFPNFPSPENYYSSSKSKQNTFQLSSDGSYKSTKYSRYPSNSLENHYTSLAKPTKTSFLLSSDGSYKSTKHSGYKPHSQPHQDQPDHHSHGFHYQPQIKNQPGGKFSNQPVNYEQYSGGGIVSNPVTEPNYFLQDIGNKYKNIPDHWQWSSSDGGESSQAQTEDVININNSEYLPSSVLANVLPQQHHPPSSSSAILMQNPATGLQTHGSSAGVTSLYDNRGVLRGESLGESIYNPAPVLPAGSIKNNNAGAGQWTPSFTPSYFIGPVNQASVDNTGTYFDDSRLKVGDDSSKQQASQHQQNIENFLTPDPNQNQESNMGFKLPDSDFKIDKFRIEDAKLLTTDPFATKNEFDVNKNDDYVYYKDGNYYYNYDEDYYYEDVSEQKEDNFIDQFHDSSQNNDNVGQISGKRKSFETANDINQFEFVEKDELPQKSEQTWYNTDYPDYGGHNHNIIVYSRPYSKTKIMNQHQNKTTESTGESEKNKTDVLNDDPNLSTNSSKPPREVTITEATHGVRISSVQDKDKEKMMIVTPTSVIPEKPYTELSDGLTLHHIHNFTYEGFNLVDLYKDMLVKKGLVEKVEIKD